MPEGFLVKSTCHLSVRHINTPKIVSDCCETVAVDVRQRCQNRTVGYVGEEGQVRPGVEITTCSNSVGQ
uniref:Uncharacterized protein n=1 Tax=Romanomermis culicivorax TaxID=13658 RepID=A0A915KF33_ROMCU